MIRSVEYSSNGPAVTMLALGWGSGEKPWPHSIYANRLMRWTFF